MPNSAAYRVSVTAMQLCGWSSKAAVDHRDRWAWLEPPDTFVDDKVSIIALLVPTRLFFLFVGNCLNSEHSGWGDGPGGKVLLTRQAQGCDWISSMAASISNPSPGAGWGVETGGSLEFTGQAICLISEVQIE